jgi:hypothetical protein
MHGQFQHNLDEQLLDDEKSCTWLKFGDIEGEREKLKTKQSVQIILKIKF